PPPAGPEYGSCPGCSLGPTTRPALGAVAQCLLRPFLVVPKPIRVGTCLLPTSRETLVPARAPFLLPPTPGRPVLPDDIDGARQQDAAQTPGYRHAPWPGRGRAPRGSSPRLAPHSQASTASRLSATGT